MDQLHMLWPAGRAAPEAALPVEYLLRNFRPSDADAYVALMHGAGSRSGMPHISPPNWSLCCRTVCS